jgi:CDP-glycerol glycerophosphotransferase
VFVGRDGGKFSDNCKHFYSALTASPPPGKRIVYLCVDAALRERIRSFGGAAEQAGTWHGLWLLLLAGTIVVDNIDWAFRGRIAATCGARIVQLWHGIPLKQIQIALFEARLAHLPLIARWLLRFQRKVIGRFAPFDWLLSTSCHVTENAFSKSFRYKNISHAGYPRNDVLFHKGNELAEHGTDEFAATTIRHFRCNTPGRTTVLYAPTFRDGFSDPICDDTLNADKFAELSNRLGILLLIKLHPWMQGRAPLRSRPGLVFVAPDCDIYPMLREIDALVTDYSSIFFDYLLLDRPVAFFPYDIENYLTKERPMYFDYATMTPGPKAHSLAELEQALSGIILGPDAWREERRRVRELVFDHQDGRAAQRLAADLFGPRPQGGRNQGLPAVLNNRIYPRTDA